LGGEALDASGGLLLGIELCIGIVGQLNGADDGGASPRRLERL
jgi:hypothetical protein